MKRILIIVFTVLICKVLFAQNAQRITVKGADLTSFYEKEEYKYPKFLQAKAYLNKGDSASGKFNYNYFDQSMRFINERGDTVTLTNEKDVNFITVATDTFFYDNGFYEWMATSATARLAIKHTFKFIERENVGAYGISSPTHGVQTIGKISGTGISYDIAPNEELIFSKETKYYISSIKGLKNNFVPANKNNLSRLFPKKNVEDYIKQNKLNLNKEEDLIDVFVYVNKPK